jgi:hypothetical protein
MCVYVYTVCQQKELRLLNAEMFLVFLNRKDLKGRNIFRCCLFVYCSYYVKYVYHLLSDTKQSLALHFKIGM